MYLQKYSCYSNDTYMACNESNNVCFSKSLASITTSHHATMTSYIAKKKHLYLRSPILDFKIFQKCQKISKIDLKKSKKKIKMPNNCCDFGRKNLNVQLWKVIWRFEYYLHRPVLINALKIKFKLSNIQGCSYIFFIFIPAWFKREKPERFLIRGVPRESV